MDDPVENQKNFVRNLVHWFNAIEHESKMLDIPPDRESYVQEGIFAADELPDKFRKAALLCLEQARLNLKDDREFRMWVLRAQKVFENAGIEDLAKGQPLRRKGGESTAEIRRAAKLEKANQAAKHYDEMTSIDPRDRADAIARRMNISPRTVRRYLKEMDRR